jgi:FMN phosphatase YigB (HAD superfamily)
MKHALFDFAGTLAELHPPREHLIQSLIHARGEVSISTKVIHRAFRAVDLMHPYSSVRILTSRQRSDFFANYNSALLAILGASHILTPQELYKHFCAQERHWLLTDRAREVLTTFKMRDYRVAVLSNFDSNLSDLIYTDYKLGTVVDEVMASQVVGLEKPDPTFFLHYLGEPNAAEKGSFYVGDNYLLDYLPSRQVGLDSFLLDPLGDYSHIPGSIPDLRALTAG